MTPAELQQLSIAALEDLKGVDVLSIDVSDRTTVTDWMVLATGTSQRHVKSLANEVSEKAKGAGVRPLGVEGEGDADWVLVDLGDVIVHVMTSESRDFYSLEKLWSVTAAERDSDDRESPSNSPDDDAVAS